MNEIPKIIHYCWFGRAPLPPLAVKCIDTWKKYLPNYEIKEWNEDNFDVNSISYTREAYSVKKYAFVSDYARFWILYKYGGIYFDTDVEVIKPIDHIITRGPFMGFENNGGIVNLMVNAGLGLGAVPSLDIYGDILKHYEMESFFHPDGSFNMKTVVMRVTTILKAKGLLDKNERQEVAELIIYPHDFFCPIRTTDGKMFATDRTVTIHHYAASWTSSTHRFLRKIVLFVGGAKLKFFLVNLLKKTGSKNEKK